MARASSFRWGALGVALTLCSGPVRAQPPEEAEPQLDESYKAAAQKLFEEGRRLMDEGRFAANSGVGGVSRTHHMTAPINKTSAAVAISQGHADPRSAAVTPVPRCRQPGS